VKLKDAREAYYDHSGKLSEIVRQLSFAGIAVVWIFRSGEGAGEISYDDSLVPALLFFVGAIAFDLLHYLYASLAWGYFQRREERKGVKDDDDVEPHDFINRPSQAAWALKSVLCITGHVILFVFLVEKI
jgi:hypothetical protein